MLSESNLRKPSATYRLVDGRTLDSLEQVATSSFLVPDHKGSFLSTEPLPTFGGGFLASFVNLSIQENAILEFANTRGPLGSHVTREFVPADQNGDLPGEDASTLQGESVDGWIEQIHLINEAVLLWDLIRKNSPELAEIFREVASGEIAISPDRRFKNLAATYRVSMRFVSGFSADRQRTAAFDYLSQVVNLNLRNHGVTAVLGGDPQHRHLRFPAQNLLGEIWLQFAKVIENGKNFFKCDSCLTWLYRPRGPRSDVNFCDHRCAREHRLSGSRKLAKRRRAEGKSYEEIAAELNERKSLIMNWIEGKRRETFREKVKRVSREGLPPCVIAAENGTTEKNVLRILADDRSR